MSVDDPKNTTKVWDGIIEYEEPVPDARTEAVKAAIEGAVTTFEEEHKEALLTILRKEHEHGPKKSEPFDEDKSSRQLTRLAWLYYWQTRVKRETMSAVDRRARLGKLAEALGKVRGMIDEAMQDDVGDDLFSAWADNTHKDEPLASLGCNDDGSPRMVRLEDEFKQATACLVTLEAAALQATNEVDKERPGGGRTKGSGWVPRESIPALANVYHSSTGARPGAGKGPFARFAYKFFAALGALNFSYNSLVDAIKDTHPQWGLDD